MGSETEPAKALLPYLQRADELQKHEPLVTYYCRLFAMEKGLKIPTKDRTKTTNSILVSLMNQLEKDKKSLKLNPEDSLYVEGFASNVFAKADKQDRAGRADLNTAKTFYAASIFFEILYQFGELQPDIEQKQKYAVWKAADIRRALKEGRKPVPGPPGGEEEITTATNFDEGSQHQESSPPKSPVARSNHHDDVINPQHPSGNSPPTSRHRSESPTSYSRHNQDESYPSDHDRFPHHSISPEIPLPPSNHPPQDQSPPNYPSPYDYDRSFENHPQHYPSHETSTGPPSQYTYTHFQTYPSFNDSSLPVAPTHHTSYYHGSDASQPVYQLPTSPPPPPPSQPYQMSSQPSPPPAQPYQMPLQPLPPPPPPVKEAPPAPTFVYDSNYQPPVEKIAEAHKAARFAVGALAFDDVPVAVDFLRRSLELLTNPSAKSH